MKGVLGLPPAASHNPSNCEVVTMDVLPAAQGMYEDKVVVVLMEADASAAQSKQVDEMVAAATDADVLVARRYKWEDVEEEVAVVEEEVGMMDADALMAHKEEAVEEKEQEAAAAEVMDVEVAVAAHIW